MCELLIKNMHNYKKIKKLSEGAFGTVYQFQNLVPSQSVPSKVAIKEIYTSSVNTKRQLEILRDLPCHRNILKIYDIIEQKFNTYVVMQLGKYDLATFIDQNSYPFQQFQIKKVAFQLLNALQVLHKKGYIHRDLKPGNIIITWDGELKLCDFGSAVKCTTGQQYELQGFTRWYKAPQMLYGCRNYKFEVDLWSLGCILMQLATGQPYIDGKSEIQQLSLIVQQLGNPNSNNWPSLSKLPDYGKLNFKQMPEKDVSQVSIQRGISKQLAFFIKKMVKFENRSTVQQLLSDQFLREVKQSSSFLLVPLSEQREKLRIQIKESADNLRKKIQEELKQC